MKPLEPCRNAKHFNLNGIVRQHQQRALPAFGAMAALKTQHAFMPTPSPTRPSARFSAIAASLRGGHVFRLTVQQPALDQDAALAERASVYNSGGQAQLTKAAIMDKQGKGSEAEFPRKTAIENANEAE